MNIDTSNLTVTKQPLEHGLTYLGVLYRPGSILLDKHALSLIIINEGAELTVIEFPEVTQLIDALREMMELSCIEAAWSVYGQMTCIDLSDPPTYMTAEVEWTVSSRQFVSARFGLQMYHPFSEEPIDSRNEELTGFQSEYKVNGGDWQVLRAINFDGDGPEFNVVNIDLMDAPGLEFEMRLTLFTSDDVYHSNVIIIPEADIQDAIRDRPEVDELPLTQRVGENKPFRVVVTTVRGATMAYSTVTDVIIEEDEYVIVRKNGDVHRLQKAEVLDLNEQRRK